MTTSTLPVTYPVHLDAELDPRLSRWLWLVKWVLVIPHYLVLAFLWIAFAVISVLAFFAILFSGRYPRALFDFNVGVLRWSWRVAYYAYGALGTDRYPPFTLREVPDYPAHLDVEYPEHLSRGLVLVKWWLLAIPHYLVVGLFAGGAGYVVSQDGNVARAGFSLIGLLVLIAGVTLLFTGRYPQRLFDFVLGLNRWVLRVAGYASLMTDRYPPFSLDQGGHEGNGVLATGHAPPESGEPPGPGGTAGPAGPGSSPTRWTTGRVVTMVVGAVVVAGAVGLGTIAGTLAVADQTARDDDGFLMSPPTTLASDASAITSRDARVHIDGPEDLLPDRVVGDVRMTASASGGEPVFIGVAATSDVDDYLDGVRRDTVLEIRDGEPVYGSREGGAPGTPPTAHDFWVAQGTGTDVAIRWAAEEGDWVVVVMNADGSPAVEADVAAGAELPALTSLVLALGGVALLLLLVGAVVTTVPVVAASRDDATPRSQR